MQAGGGDGGGGGLQQRQGEWIDCGTPPRPACSAGRPAAPPPPLTHPPNQQCPINANFRQLPARLHPPHLGHATVVIGLPE